MRRANKLLRDAMILFTASLMSIGQASFQGMFFAAAIKDGVADWGASRNCVITKDGSAYIVRSMEDIKPVLEEKRSKYNLSTQAQRWTIKGITHAYLDEVSVQEFGPLRQNCRVNAEVMRKVMLPSGASSPDTGIVDVDGSRRGAEILIDGAKKGYIRQAFVLSTGEHVWKTMKCEERIHVRADQTQQVYCDKE